MPVYYNLYSNLLLNKYFPNDPSAHIEINTYPLPRVSSVQPLDSSLTAVIISIGFAFIPASIANFIVKERNLNSKHMQFISGII